jgi:hypothetical protein
MAGIVGDGGMEMRIQMIAFAERTLNAEVVHVELSPEIVGECAGEGGRRFGGKRLITKRD